MITKLADHLSNAKKGDRESESKLCNRLGQLRRNITFDCLTDDLRITIKEACDWLRTTGRTVDFTQTNPGMWITSRDGKTPGFKIYRKDYMVQRIKTLMGYHPHFTLIINGRRMFQCFFSEADRDRAYLWMEGYVHGLNDPSIQFDDKELNDVNLHSLIMW